MLYKSVRRSDRLWVWKATFQTKFQKFEFVRINKSNPHSFYILFFDATPNRVDKVILSFTVSLSIHDVNIHEIKTVFSFRTKCIHVRYQTTFILISWNPRISLLLFLKSHFLSYCWVLFAAKVATLSPLEHLIFRDLSSNLTRTSRCRPTMLEMCENGQKLSCP